MPPSGYSRQQSGSISHFLRSCSEALERENRAKDRGPTEALRSECADIERALGNGIEDPLVRSVLALTREFYADVESQAPQDYGEFRTAVSRSLERTEKAILDVHVEPYFEPSPK